MSGREEMLERIRKALGRAGKHADRAPEIVATPPEELTGVMPPIAPENLVPKFEAELGKVSGCTYRASTLHELEEIIRKILEESGATSVAISRNPLLSKLGLAERTRAWGKSATVWPEARDTSAPGQASPLGELAVASFSATVGITGVDFALAETGSLVLSSLTEGSQLVSLAPPVHLALYRRNQVIGSLDDVLERLPVPRDPQAPAPGRSVVIITGPSRTADIEQILIRGVHGPKEVHAILVEESCLVGEGSALPPRK